MIPENPNLQDPSLASAAAVLAEKGGSASFGSLSKKELQEEVEIKPLVRHVLSKELQTYYDTVIIDLQSADTERINAALYSVTTDSGLQQLVPYFVQFVTEMIPKNLHSLPQLHIYIGLIRSLLSNEHIFIEPYVSCLYSSLYADSTVVAPDNASNPELSVGKEAV